MEDAAIVELYWQRSEEAIPETEYKYGQYCGAIAKNICHSIEDAEECVNDTWLRAWNRMPSERPSVLSTFLGAITRNLALDRWRNAHRQKRGGGETDLALEELSDCVPAPGGVEREMEAKELARAIDAFVASLQPTERRLFLARYWFLTPVKELAERLSWSQSKTKTTLFRLRKRLLRQLKEEGLC